VLFSQLSTNGSSAVPKWFWFWDRTFTLRCSRLRGEIPEPLLITCKEAESPAEHGRPLLEVRRCGDGHPPVTERERVIRLNGIGGVRFKTRIEFSIRVFSEARRRDMSSTVRMSYLFLSLMCFPALSKKSGLPASISVHNLCR